MALPNLRRFCFILMPIYAHYNKHDHERFGDIPLKENAKIIDISSKEVGLKGNHVYRTIVTFDDGYKYISHDTNREDHFLSYTISISAEDRLKIIERAIKAHQERVEEEENRRSIH